jgi:prepilin-type N-terminal cleavage/methylation domain-containing protein
MRRSEKGFTLIELLIVIVIIGILAGVLIAVIDPTRQQNRARDANVIATLNKVALATEGFISAYGRSPTDVEFFESIQNASDVGSGTCTLGDADTNVCTFEVTGNALPTTCETTDWNGHQTAAVTQCYYRYWREEATTDTTHFRLYAKSFGIANVVFMYDNHVATITECDASGASIVADVVSGGAPGYANLTDADGPCVL